VLSESVAAGNAETGFYAFTVSGKAPTSLMVSHSVAANNATGVVAKNSGATLRLANSTVTGNTNGWTAPGGVVDSYGDNYMKGNSDDSNHPALTKISPE
jgi:hypothetical protein